MALFDAQAALQDVLSNVFVHDVEPAVSVRALAIADQLRQRASYDAQYLALAEHLGCELWTADERFWNAARPAFPQVRWVGEIRTGTAT
jgi:predicted nucleic acid-binding protein